jgi:hypothetical protein
MTTSNLPMATVLSELGEIQSVMRSTPQTYFRDADLQQRYRSLLEQKQGGGVTVLDQPDSAPLVPILGPKEYAAECAKAGVKGNFSEYLRVMRTISDVVFAMPAGEQRGFVNSFERLPEKVQAACYREAVSRAPSIVPASSTIIAKFAQEPEGALLVKEWGHLASANHERVRERLWRVRDELFAQSEGLEETFVSWLMKTLSVTQRVGLYRKMAAA